LAAVKEKFTVTEKIRKGTVSHCIIAKSVGLEGAHLGYKGNLPMTDKILNQPHAGQKFMNSTFHKTHILLKKFWAYIRLVQS